MKEIFLQDYFYGFLSSKEAEILLHFQPVGTYLFRLSQTSPGAFALTFVHSPQRVVNILFKSAQPDGFVVRDENSQKEVTFQNFQEIISYYQGSLKRPFLSPLPLRPWFLGEITSEEALGLLFGMPVGTFLIRFSSRVGFFAASFVDPDRQVRHVLIEDVVDETGQEAFRIQNEEVLLPSIDDLIVYYGNTLVYPYYQSGQEIDIGRIKEIVYQTFDSNLSAQMHYELELERANRRSSFRNSSLGRNQNENPGSIIYQSISLLKKGPNNNNSDRNTNFNSSNTNQLYSMPPQFQSYMSPPNNINDLSEEDSLDILLQELQTN